MTHPNGRPTLYTDELAEEICQAIATLPMGLERIVKVHPHFPTERTIYDWMRKRTNFLQMYMQAKANQANVLMDRTIDVGNYDEYEGDDKDTLIKINRAKLKVDIYKHNAARLNPHIYSERAMAQKHDVTVRQEDALKELS